MKDIKHNNLHINIDSLGRLALSHEAKKTFPPLEIDNINTNVSVGSGYQLWIKDGKMGDGRDFLVKNSVSARPEKITVKYFYAKDNLNITEHFYPQNELNAVVQNTEIKNCGAEDIILTRASSANVLYIGLDEKPWIQNRERFLIHYCVSAWQGEGQWRTATPQELGLYPATLHWWEKSSFSISSQSSWSTARYYPVLIIEDTEKKECWFFEHEGACSWSIECSSYQGLDSRFLTVSICSADEKNNWTYRLHSGEAYTTDSAVYGLVKGGFTEAIRELTAYKRKTSMCKSDMPVIFNDFMNCSWGNPSAENLLPLIDTAALVGCECFCIDAGWQKDLGDWRPDNSKFSELGLKGIIEYISNRGMRPGLWFEFECCSKEFANAHKDWVITRNGEAICSDRPLLDMKNPKVINHLKKSVDLVYKFGVRYIKNDYNNNTGIGTDKYDKSPAEGTRENTIAFYKFIDKLKKQYPDLVIENCGSGAMRCDNGTLKHFDLQSSSDQENYLMYPSILVGSSALVPPEKLGLWSYPYPQSHADMGKTEFSSKQIKNWRDGEQTIFNMVSGFMGQMYLSGHIDRCDEYNRKLITDAITVYKKWRGFIANAYPEYLCNMRGMHDKAYNAYGLISEDKKTMLLAVWNINSTKFSIDIDKYLFDNIEMLYPDNFQNYKAVIQNGKLNINTGGKYRARLLLLTTKDEKCISK